MILARAASITKSIRSFFSNILNTLIEARQKQVNYKIAEMIQRNEYRNESVYTIYEAIQNNKLGSLKK